MTFDGEAAGLLLPQNRTEFPCVNGRPPAVYEIGQQLLGFGETKMNRFSIRKNLKIAEGLHTDAFSGGERSASQFVKFFPHPFGSYRL